MDVERHRKEIRRLVAEAPDEPTYCEFKEALSYATKKEKSELVKDVSSFANSDLEALGGYGYLIFGVSGDGRVVGITDADGDPASASRQIVNGNLGRSVNFEYLTCEVDDKTGGTKRVAAIVIPDSRRRPHVASREIKERMGNRDRFWLREGEAWVRKTGGRELATADDLDTMYEGKLRRLVDAQVRPLRERITQLEQALRERTDAAPKPSLGLLTLNSTNPSVKLRPYPVVGSLIEAGRIQEEVESALAEASNEPEPRYLVALGYSDVVPTAADYEEYADKLQEWFATLKDLFVVDFVLANTGGAPAEEVQIVVTMPAALRPMKTLPARPERPSRYSRYFDSFPTLAPSVTAPTRTRPDRIIGPRVRIDDASGRAAAFWEVGKLYHDRPLFMRSGLEKIGEHGEIEKIGGLVVSGGGLREHVSRGDSGTRLDYTIRAANVPETVRGVLVLE